MLATIKLSVAFPLVSSAFNGQRSVHFSESLYDFRRELAVKTGHKNHDKSLRDTKNLYRTEEID